MKVFLISRGYPTEAYKMYGIFERDQAEALAKAGIDLVFLSVDMRSFRRKRSFGTSFFEKNGVKVYSISWPIGAVPKKLFYSISYLALKKIYKQAVKKEGKPDILHAYFTDQAYIGSKLARETGIPFVITEPNSHINVENIEKSLREAADYAYHNCDQLITVSPDFQKKVKRKFGVDSEIVTILPNMDIFSYSEEKDKDLFRIVCAGGLIVPKGMKELIDGFYHAFKDDEKVTLTIFGEGPERWNLEKQIKDYGLENRIFLKGLVFREVLAEEYRRSNLFCLYSHMETFGLAYLEALASGLPIVSPKCGGPEHLIREDNGLLVELFDQDALVSALKYMRENINKYDGKGISTYTKEEYSKEKITGKLISIYEKVLGKRG